MGYTHYWKTKKRPTNKQWDAIVADIEKLFAAKEIKPLIKYESDKTTPPIVNAEFIRFNGRRHDGHETFFFDRDKTDFAFCKTAYKPYDKAVVASLIIANHHAPDCYEINSDGDKNDWQPAQLYLTRILGEEYENPIRNR